MLRSKIEIHNQSLRLALDIAGVPFALHYRSDRVPGRLARRIRIPLTAAAVPPGLLRIDLEVECAGQRFAQSFPPEPNQTHLFSWDGRDGSGAAVAGRQMARIRIGSVHRSVFRKAGVTRWREFERPVGAWDARQIGLGGWSLGVHHVYDRAGGILLFGDGRWRRVSAESARVAASEIVIRPTGLPGPMHAFVFDESGRHLRTLRSPGDTTVYSFEYDGDGGLTAVAGGDGNVTRVERSQNAGGGGRVVVSPFGQRTELVFDGDGNVAGATNPAGETIRFGYAAGGLLTLATSARGDAERFDFDELGRLVRHVDAAGTVTELAGRRDESESRVAVLRGDGRESLYVVERLPRGARRRTNSCCGGRQTIAVRQAGGSRVVTYPDGRTVETTGGIPETAQTTTTPRGLRRTVRRGTSGPAGAFDRRIEINGRSYVTRVDATARTSSTRSPAGRVRSRTFDSAGRIREERIGEREATRAGFDERGRLVTIAQGTGADARELALGYDPRGRIGHMANGLGDPQRFEWDEAGRLIAKTSADGTAIAFAYDAGGNRASLTPAGKPAHRFRHDGLGRIVEYMAPHAEGKTVRFERNGLGRLTRVTREDGESVEFEYGERGDLAAVSAGAHRVVLESDATSSRLLRASTGDGSVSYEYDGPLRTRLRWDGPVAGVVERTFDNDFRLSSTKVNAEEPVALEYDADGLLTRAGQLLLEREPANSGVRRTTLGVIETEEGRNGFGEPISLVVRAGGTEIFSVRTARDELGRILEESETIEGKSVAESYLYDKAGRLREVQRRDGIRSQYGYDENGNRTTFAVGERNLSGSYDERDRVNRYGAASYRFTASGDLSSRNINGKVTDYTYDGFGNLRAVSLADGRRIEYLIDAGNRRIGKKLGGVLMQAFLYQDGIAPIAELDARGAVTARFVYATRLNVPDYLIKTDGADGAGSRAYRIIANHVGSPRLVVDAATGAIAQRLDYDEFGKVVLDTNPGFQPFGFAGGLWDRDTGLVRFGARDYDPMTGRWTSRDPLLFGGGSANLYAYAGNDPVNRADPLGLTWRGYFPGSGPSWHHNRNGGQNCPPTSPDPYSGDCPDELEPTGWHAPSSRSAEHGNHWSFRHESPGGWLPQGGWQCIYDDNGNRVDGPVDGGSYDYFSPQFNPDGSPDFTSPSTWLHGVYDYIPWVLFGN